MRSCSVCKASVWESAKRCPACGAELALAETNQTPSGIAGDGLIGRRMGGKFVLRELIGAGATGRVYRADQVTLGRTVAVKVLRSSLAGDPEVVRRFHDEALAASRLNHPNTVSVIDYGQTEDGLLYIVMEYLRGRTLTQLLRAEYPVPYVRALGLVGQVLTALEEAHAAGVIHADLKSDNIVVETLRGGGDLVKVVDFGIARLIDAAAQDPALGRPVEFTSRPDTRPNKSICGTPEYMAPEVIAGGDATFATDLYGAAIVLYELLTSATPFAGGSSLDVLSRHLQEYPVPPTKKRAELPPVIDEIVMRGLAKKPDERHTSAAAFRTVLEAAVRAAAPAPGSGDWSEASDSGVERRCGACGASSPSRFKFCPECGVRMETVPPVAARSAPVEATDTQRLTQQAAELAVQTATQRWSKPTGSLFPLPLVGRAAELASVQTFLAGGGHSSTMQVVAPLGWGKTRLVAEACRASAQKGTTIYVASADPSGLRTPWYPIRAVVAAILDLPPVCPTELLRERLEEIGLSHRDEPGISELFGIDGELGQLEAAVRRRECTAATLRVLRAAAGPDGRAALVFDDVDRYDQLSADLLRRLAEHPVDTPVRLLVTNEPAHANRWPDGVARVELHPLGGANLTAIADHLGRVYQSTGNSVAPDPAALAQASQGVPAQLEHALRYWIEGGTLDAAPPGLADLIAARYELLPVEARVALQAIAVAGLDTSVALVARTLVATGEGTAESLAGALPLLEARGLVSVDDDLVAIPHELVRDVAYDAMPADIRHRLHAALREAYSEKNATPLLIGHHADLGGQPLHAVAFLIVAGDEAVRRFDDAGACILYRRALDAARRALLHDDQGARERDFLIASVKLADSLRITGELTLARGVISEAMAFSDGQHHNLDAQLRRVLGHLALSAGEPERALPPLREALGLAIPTGDVELVVDLYLDLAAVYLRSGATQTAITEVDEGVNFVTVGEGPAAVDGPAGLWKLLVRQAELLRAVGRRRDALITASHSLRHAVRARSAVGRGRTHSLLASLYEQERDHEAAGRHRQAAVDEMRRLGDRRTTAELLLSGTSPTASLMRIQIDGIHEARILASEIGWTEGVRKASTV